MADITATIRTLTLANGTVSGLVGTRMYSDILPQSATMPAIVYFCVDTQPNEALTQIVDVFRARVQIDCYASTRSGANALADAVRLALEQKHRGLQSGTRIKEISLFAGQAEGIDRPLAGEDARRFITSQDFFVFYSPST